MWATLALALQSVFAKQHRRFVAILGQMFALQQLCTQLFAWLQHQSMRLRSPLVASRFDSIWSIANLNRPAIRFRHLSTRGAIPNRGIPLCAGFVRMVGRYFPLPHQGSPICEMDIRLQSTPELVMNSPQEELARFQVAVAREILHWESVLLASPDSLFDIEKIADHYFRNAAGKIVACLLAATSRTPEIQAAVEPLQRDAVTPLRPPIRTSLLVRLLCGLVLEITTLYCAPARSNDRNTVTEERRGLYPELALYGFAKGVSACLEDRIVRAATLYPSCEVARRELEKDGLDLDVKTIRRVTLHCGETLLALRREKVELFLSGVMPAGDALCNKNVVVEEDGGRMRQRENIVSALKKPGDHPKFRAEWREPKLFIIYCVDENGKKEKESQVWIDATFQGADHAAEMLAATLHQLGVAKAKSVTFLADGANCLWDRFDWIVEAVHLNKNRVHFVLDFFHAAHHVSLAIAELGYENSKRRELYKELRHELRQSRWEYVVGRLEEWGKELLERAAKETTPESKTGASNFVRELNYLRKHGVAGHLCYVKFSRRGLPLGSGAVESAIRRVINLRLKSNGMFWTPENAEKILQVRCQLLSTRWENCCSELRLRRRRRRDCLWRWEAMDRSSSGRKAKADSSQKPTKCRNSSVQRS
jgi:hypothetical protein